MVRKEITFNQAVQQPNLRQPFLNNYLDSHPHEGVEKILYDHHGSLYWNLLSNKRDEKVITHEEFEEEKEGFNDPLRSFLHSYTLASVPYFSLRIIGQGLSLPILVNPKAFDKSEGLFDSTIQDHEYVHAEKACEGYPLGHRILTGREFLKLPQDITFTYFELVAYTHQLSKLNERNLNPKDIEVLLDCALREVDQIPKRRAWGLKGALINEMRRQGEHITALTKLLSK